MQGHGAPSSSLEQNRLGNPVGNIPGQVGLEHQLAEMSLAKPKSDEGNCDAIAQYDDLIAEYNSLRALHKSAQTSAATTSRQLSDLSKELAQAKQQLVEESNTRITLAKDNDLLRSQISEMSIAQELLRGRTILHPRVYSIANGYPIVGRKRNQKYDETSAFESGMFPDYAGFEDLW